MDNLEDVCGLHSASADVCELVDAADLDNVFAVHNAPVELRLEAVDALRSCRVHECPVHAAAALDLIQLLEERPCKACGVWTDGDELCDASELSPVAGDICSACWDALEAETHREECECEPCGHARSKAGRISREREAQVRGGISRVGLHLVGIDPKEL